MDNKESYIAKNEIKVASLLSDMYNNESRLLSKLEKKKAQLNLMQEEFDELNKDYQNQRKIRNDLDEKFKALKEPNASDWESFKSEYELVLDFAEGDKSNFIQKAETFMEELNRKSNELSEKLKDSAEATRTKSQQMIDELNERKEELQKRLDTAKEDTGEIWMEVKQWFIERAKSIRSTL